jgi:uncharacterized protein
VKGWLASRMPTRESLLQQRWIRPFAHKLTHPALWHFNRWSVSRGLALGLFCGFLIPIGQIFLAALFALTARANLIVAAVATLVTNPFTFPAIYWAAYHVGQSVLAPERWALFNPDAADTMLLRSAAWMLSVSVPTALGLILFAGGSAAAGYFFTQFGWKMWIRRRWLRRRSARAARPA